MELMQVLKAGKDGITVTAIRPTDGGIVLQPFVNGDAANYPVELKKGDVLQVPISVSVSKSVNSYSIEWAEG